MNESHPTTAEEQIAAIRGEIAEAVHRLERHDGFLFAVMLGLRALQSQAHYDHSRFLESLLQQQDRMAQGIARMAEAERAQLEAILHLLSLPPAPYDGGPRVLS